LDIVVLFVVGNRIMAATGDDVVSPPTGSPKRKVRKTACGASVNQIETGGNASR